jgi:hypothetical protein
MSLPEASQLATAAQLLRPTDQSIPMIPLPAVTKMTVERQLNMMRSYLKILLRHAPPDNPIGVDSIYSLSHFELPKELVEDIGEIQTLDQELENMLGARKYGLKLKEWGPQLEVLVDKLEEWSRRLSSEVVLHEPGNLHGEILLEKWISAVFLAVVDALENAELMVGILTVDPKAVSDIDIQFSRVLTDEDVACNDLDVGWILWTLSSCCH